MLVGDTERHFQICPMFTMNTSSPQELYVCSVSKYTTYPNPIRLVSCRRKPMSIALLSREVIR